MSFFIVPMVTLSNSLMCEWLIPVHVSTFWYILGMSIVSISLRAICISLFGRSMAVMIVFISMKSKFAFFCSLSRFALGEFLLSMLSPR